MSIDATRREEAAQEVLPAAITTAVAVVLWRVFTPGILSADGLYQYSQALTGRYEDWHPPVMALLARLAISLGAGLDHLMFAQCLAGCFGVRALALEVMVRLGVRRRTGAWLSIGVLLILLMPWSPLAFYLMWFLKDAWVAIALVWVVVLLLRLDSHRIQDRSSSRILLTIATVVTMTLAAVTRHNSLALAPLFAIVLARACSHGSPARGWAVAASLAGTMAVAMIAQRYFVARSYPSQQVMALDLVGMLAQHPEMQGELPHTSAHVSSDFASRYRSGDVSPMFWEEPPIVDRAYLPRLLTRNDSLVTEHRRAVLRHPTKWLGVRVRAYAALLDPWRTTYWVETTIPANEFGLQHRVEGSRTRAVLVAGARRVERGSVTRWLSGVHLIWTCINVALMVVVLVQRRRGSRNRSVTLLILCIPLVYSASFFPAVTALDFRFLYPATLMVQVITLSGIGGWLARARR